MNANVPVYLIRKTRRLSSGKRITFYQLRWYSSDGKEQTESIGRTDEITRRQAEQARRAKELAIGSGKQLRDKPRKMTLAAFLDAHRKAIQADVRPSTLIEYELAAKHAIAALGAEIELTRIGWTEVGILKAYMAETKKHSAGTIIKTLRTLRAAFNRAAAQGLVHSNPFAKAVLPRPESRPKRIFTRAEVDALVSASPSLWWQAFITLAVTSGMRRNELLNLLWSDIDMNEATARVDAKRAETLCVAGQTIRTWEWAPKASASYRTIPLPDETIALLNRLRVKMGASPFVFLDMERVKQIQRHITDGRLPAKFDLVHNLIREFAVIQEAARALLAKQRGVSVDQVPWQMGCLHDLRRTYCTMMADVVPMHILRQWAGHADIATTAAFYLGVNDGMAERARKAFGAAS